jgi:hypothetical protein
LKENAEVRATNWLADLQYREGDDAVAHHRAEDAPALQLGKQRNGNRPP